MKKVTILFITMSLLILNSCQEKDDSIDVETQQAIDYSEYGKLHNEGLDFIYEELKKDIQLNKSFSSREIGYSRIQDLTLTFLGNQDNFDFEESRSTLNKSRSFLKVFSNKDKIKSSERLIPLWNGYDQLTTLQKKYLTELENIMYSGASVNQVQSEMSDLYLVVDKNIESQEEKEMILLGITVGKYSLNYWKENYSKWLTLKNKNKSNNYGWDDLGDSLISMAGSDVAGAVVGSVGGAPGAFGVGLTSSAVKGIEEAWDSFF